MDTPNHVCNVYSVSWLHIMYHICPIYTHTWYMMMIKMYTQICDIIVIIIIIFIIIIIIIIFILQSGCWLLLSRASVRAGRLSFRVTWSSSILVRTQSRSAPARLPACLHWICTWTHRATALFNHNIQSRPVVAALLFQTAGKSVFKNPNKMKTDQ